MDNPATRIVTCGKERVAWHWTECQTKAALQRELTFTRTPVGFWTTKEREREGKGREKEKERE